MNFWKLSTLGLGLALAATLAATHATTVSADQPHMRNAHKLLVDARAELDKATPDKGGHRVKAIQLVTDAIAEVHAGIQFDEHH
jgi:hypothetical protein